MSFIFKCENCKTKFEAKDEWDGIQTECPTCQAQITVVRERPNIEPTTVRKRANLKKMKNIFATVGGKVKSVYEKIPEGNLTDATRLHKNRVASFLTRLTVKQIALIISIVTALLVCEYLFFGQLCFGILKESLEVKSHREYWHKGYDAARSMMFSDVSETKRKDHLIEHFMNSCGKICPRRLDDVFAFANGYYYSIKHEVTGNTIPKSDFIAAAKYAWGIPR